MESSNSTTLPDLHRNRSRNLGFRRVSSQQPMAKPLFRDAATAYELGAHAMSIPLKNPPVYDYGNGPKTRSLTRNHSEQKQFNRFTSPTKYVKSFGPAPELPPIGKVHGQLKGITFDVRRFEDEKIKYNSKFNRIPIKNQKNVLQRPVVIKNARLWNLNLPIWKINSQ